MTSISGDIFRFGRCSRFFCPCGFFLPFRRCRWVQNEQDWAHALMDDRSRLVGSGLLKRHAPEVSLLQRIADGGIVVLAHWLASVLYQQPWIPDYTLATAVAVTIFYVAAEGTGLYRSWRGASLGTEIRLIVVAWALTVAALLLLIIIGFAYVSFDLYLTAKKAQRDTENYAAQLTAETARRVALSTICF